MKYSIKIIPFIILILSLSLVLSACGNKITEEQNNQETEEQMNERTEEQNNQETEEQMNERTEELNINRWRSYENEYFNLKFKYHNNWYFQRDNLNQGDYIAVYGFSPSAEGLQNKEYAIKLFILNKDQDFTEDFNLIKEKVGDNKKYILVANNTEYQDVLNLMEENLEIMSKDEGAKEPIEMNEFFYQDLKNEFKTIDSELIIRDYFKVGDMVRNAKGCGKDLDQSYFENILGKFSESEIGHSYAFTDINTQEIGGHYQIIIIPNNLGYSSSEEFNQDFELCEAGAEAYPKAVSENYLLFENSCGSGMGSTSAEVCDNTKSKISPTIKLK